MDNEWWRGAVLYQIYPRSFKDSNNDGVGDLNGIIGKLDYIASLGVEGVWLSPFYKSPMADFGYDVEDYCAIDPLFGSMKDFDDLLKAMHQRGLKLVVDVVLSHTSIKHPWFIESQRDPKGPKADWYTWVDARPDGTPPNNWLSVFGGPAWTFDTRRGQYYYHQFLKEQPDLNVRNPAVQDALLDVAKFWLDKGVDGFRLDAVNHCIHDAQLRDNLPKPPEKSTPDRPFKNTYDMQWHKYDKSQPENLDFMRKIRALTDKYEGRMMVAEIGDDHNIERCLEYTGPGLLHTAYSFTLLTDKYGATVVRNNVVEFRNQSKQSWPSWSFSNHDVKRVASRWAINGAPSEAQAKMLQALVASLWGTIFVYQGEELGLTDADIPFEKLQDPFGKFGWPENKGRDGCRTPMPWESQKAYGGFSEKEPWLPMPQDHLQNAVDAQEKNRNSPLHFFRNFMKWRKQHAALIRGDIAFLEAADPVLAFTRSEKGEKSIAVFNMSDKPAAYALPAGTKAIDGHGLPYALKDEQIALPAFGGFFGRLQ